MFSILVYRATREPGHSVRHDYPVDLTVTTDGGGGWWKGTLVVHKVSFYLSNPERKSPMLKVWLDDVRPAPRGWVWCKEVSRLKPWLQSDIVLELSLDHDLGLDQPSGYDLVKWMAYYKLWPRNKPTVHTANPRGREDMEKTIERYYPK